MSACEFIPRGDCMDIDFPCGRVEKKVNLDFCEFECPFDMYYRCDTVAIANDILRDAESA